MEEKFDALVIGAGAGGMCAAARLAHKGYKTLLVEAHDRVGGRASTRELDGFLLNTGALVIERGGAVEQTLNEVGVSLNLFVPKPETELLIGKWSISLDTGLVGTVRNWGPHILNFLSKFIPYFRPQKGESVSTWLGRFTKNNFIHGLTSNVIGAMFAASSNDLPADVFLHYFTKGSAFKKIGLAPGGTIEVWKPLIPVIRSTGGDVWLSSSVKKLTFNDQGLTDGAEIEHNGKTVRVSVKVVISNVGPLATVKIGGAEHFPDGYAEFVEKNSDPSAIITVHFASRIPLAKFKGLALVGKSRRMVYAANFSQPEQMRCPEGWYLYCAASVPRPARGQFDLEKEKALLLEDVKDHFPGFEEHGRVLAIDVTAHEWPAQRAVTGFDLPMQTPVKNLWNVGDGSKPWGEAGTVACAKSAKVVVDDVLAKYPLKMVAPIHEN